MIFFGLRGVRCSYFLGFSFEGLISMGFSLFSFFMDLHLKPRKIGRVNVVGLSTLIKREVSRFAGIYIQTILAPVVTTLLFYAVFALAFGGAAREIDGVPFLKFLAPGLIMMTMVQNAFANSSSSMVISKIQGSIVDVLMPPLSHVELMTGFLVGAVVRGVSVGLATSLVMSVFVPMSIHSLGLILLFGFLGSLMLGALGLAGGIWSEKFDHISAVTNFIVTPLTFLSGTFYSMENLPEMWQGIARYNPFFYMIDGFRYGFIGRGDSDVILGIGVLGVVNVGLIGLILWMLRIGYKIKS